MANPESLRQILHSRAPLSTWLGIVLLFAVFGVIVLAIIGPSPRGNDYEEMRAKKRMENLKTLREDAEKTLNTYAWVDKNKGVVRIPISRAMKLTVAELAKKKPAPAGPIATPQTQASPAAAASAGPASPAPAGSVKPGTSQPAASPSAQAPSSPAPPSAAGASPAPQNAPSAAPQSPAPASPAPASSP